MAPKTATPHKSYATELESSVAAAVRSVRDAQGAVAALRRSPELGFFFDPSAFHTELENALGELLLVRRMVKAAKGEVAP